MDRSKVWHLPASALGFDYLYIYGIRNVCFLSRSRRDIAWPQIRTASCVFRVLYLRSNGSCKLLSDRYQYLGPRKKKKQAEVHGINSARLCVWCVCVCVCVVCCDVCVWCVFVCVRVVRLVCVVCVCV